MSILKFKTNINCGGCKASATPFLNSIAGIKTWNVDINDPTKMLTVEGEGVNPKIVVEALAKAGFTAIPA